jgi:predicted DNA-binding transcriptional regulator YafY
MLASRLLSTLMLLQTRGRMSAPDLAKELEVSVRTIYRDIDQLSAAGIPVMADPGPAAELGLADRMSSARLKLMAALPAGMRAERVATRFHLDVTGWFRATEPVALLPTVARAVWSESYLRIRYRQGGNSNESCSRPAFGTSSRKRAAPIAHTGRQIFRRWNLSMSHSHAPRALI